MILGVALIMVSALAVTVVAVARARAARAALRVSEETIRQFVQPPQNMESVGRLVGDVAHDLNDLLTAITGNTELLIAHLPRADPILQDAHEVRRAALSAARLTRQLLALSRSQRTPVEVIDVNAVVARTAGVLRGMLGEDIAVTLVLGDIRRIKAGASHVEEIVLNLALNARDAMPTGGRLTLTTTMHTRLELDAPIGSPGEYVRLIVADTGGGIPEAAQSKVFEPFFSTPGAGEGAVGLAKVDAIVKEGGGHIQLDSKAGVGTTFTVDLPAMSDSPAVFDPQPPVSRPMGRFAPIMIVEDEPRVRELMRLVLVRAGHDVQAVAGPHEALAALNRHPDISLMLIDIVMPEMNGYDLAEEARKIVPGVRIVFTSGFARDAVRQPATDGFLAKPFTVESLTDLVQQALAEI